MIDRVTNSFLHLIVAHSRHEPTADMNVFLAGLPRDFHPASEDAIEHFDALLDIMEGL